MLVAVPISWGNASRTLELEFGTTKDAQYVRADDAISRRADSTSKEIGFSFIDKTIFSQDGITQKCKDCSGQATFSIASGAVKLVNEFDELFKDLGADGLNLETFADSADVDIVVTNMGAKFEFETDILLSKDFTFHLAGGPVSLTGFSVGYSNLGEFNWTNYYRSPAYSPLGPP